jgi:hypothetical protein
MNRDGLNEAWIEHLAEFAISGFHKMEHHAVMRSIPWLR